MNIDSQAITRALDLDPADRGVRQFGEQEIADLPVFDDVVGVFLAIGEPTALPLGGDTEPEAVGVDFLTPQLASSAESSPSSSSVDVPASVNPAASAAAVVANHTSATVFEYQRPSGW